MGTLTCDSMVDEVQALVGRTGDTVLISDARVTRWLNDAQKYIVKNTPGLLGLQFKNVTSHDFATDTISYAINDITCGDTTDEAPCHIDAAWYLDGAESIRLDFKPTDEFDELLIDPTSSDHSGQKPTRWTRRGNYIEIAPRPSSTYNGKDMRVDGVRYAAEFTTNDSSASELEDADSLLIGYAVAEAWNAIGTPEALVKAAQRRQKFLAELADYRDFNSRMDAWDYNTLFDYEE